MLLHPGPAHWQYTLMVTASSVTMCHAMVLHGVLHTLHIPVLCPGLHSEQPICQRSVHQAGVVHQQRCYLAHDGLELGVGVRHHALGWLFVLVRYRV